MDGQAVFYAKQFDLHSATSGLEIEKVHATSALISDN